jgi:hypothetical protein
MNDRLRFVTLLSLLGGMEPSTDGQPLPTVLAIATDDNLLHAMKAATRLDLEEHELVPRRRHRFVRHAERFGWAAVTLLLPMSVQLERAAPLGLPELEAREGHVEDVGEATGADEVVVGEEVAAAGVRRDGHVLVLAWEGPTARHGAQEGPEGGGVEGVAELEERGEEGELGGGEVGEGSEVARLVELVDVRLLLREMQLAQTFVLDLLEEVPLEQLVDDAVSERFAAGVGRVQLMEVGRIKEPMRE